MSMLDELESKMKADPLFAAVYTIATIPLGGRNTIEYVEMKTCVLSALEVILTQCGKKELLSEVMETVAKSALTPEFQEFMKLQKG